MILIKNYNNYYVNIKGEVLNKNTNKILKPISGSKGYIGYRLSKNNIAKNHFQHKLIAEYFIPNPLNKQFVNHINGIKYDNRIENLEWVTASENTIHAYKNKLMHKNINFINAAIKRCSRIVLDTETGIYYDSVKEAATLLGLNHGTLISRLNGNCINNTNLKYV